MILRRFAQCLALWALVNAPVVAEPTEPPADDSTAVSFAKQVRPILAAHCVGCHQPAKQGGELDLTDFAALLLGGESDMASVAPGDPEGSYLLDLITPDADGNADMPKEAPALAASDVELIRQWIAAGAVNDSPRDRGPRYTAASPPEYRISPTITALDVSPDGGLLAVNGFHEVLLHRLDDAPLSGDGQAQPVARLVGLSARVQSVRFSPDGTKLAVVGGDPSRRGEVQIWDMATHDLLLSHSVTYDTLYGVSWSPDGEHVAFGCADNTVRAIHAATGKQVLYQAAHNDWVLDTVYSVDGSHLVSAGRDQTLKLIEVATERFIDNITSITPGALTGGINAVARHPARDEVLVGGADGVPKIYQMQRTTKRVIGDDANLLWELPGLPGRVFSVAYNRDGTRLAAGSSLDGTGTVHVYSMAAEPPIPKEIKELLHKPTHKRNDEEKTKLADHFAAHVEQLCHISVPTGGVYAVAFTADGQSVISAGADGVVRIHRAGDGTSLGEFTPVPIAEARASSTDVAQTAAEQGPSFRVDVMPALAKMGCNAGTCHGAKDGKNGFKLSLRGYDPVGDLRALTDDLTGRRTNRAAPEQSLMLLKAVAAVPHEGGQRTTTESDYYAILRDWISHGMPDDPQAAKVTRIEISPENPVVPGAHATVDLQLTAIYTDGSERDVTRDAFFTSGNTDVAAVDDSGQMTAIRRGESPVLARYEGAYAATTLTVMGDRDEFAWNFPPTHNYIDELVDAKLQRVKTLPSPLAGDAEFLRRAYLDLTGLPPSAEKVREFLADDRPLREKRETLIDQLLASDEFVDHRTNKWCDLLMVNSKFLGVDGAQAFRDWIRKAVATNMPYDQFVAAILTASGSNRENPPAGYYKSLRTPDALMENTTHLFLGVRFNCNKCHDHPFERWTQDQYYGLSAFFAQTQLQTDPESKGKTVGGTSVEVAKPLYEIVTDASDGEVTHERTGEIAPPEFPYEHEFNCDDNATRRERLAAWITSAENEYFARSFVNRMWGYLLGTGLIEPIDDIRAGNPPTNPELMERLTQDFVAAGFDTRHLIRTICQSRTYQLSSRTNRWNEDDAINFSHAKPRRLPAEVLYDTLHAAVGAGWDIPSAGRGVRASQLPDVQLKLPDLFLDQLGRPSRESACECERSDDLMLGPVMAMVNGPAVAEAIVDPENELARLEREIDDDRALVDELFLRILNRPPSEAEVTAALETVRAHSDEHAVVKQRAADLTAQRDAVLPKWEESQRFMDWVTPRPTEVKSTGNSALQVQLDSSIFATGEEGKPKYVVVLDTDLPQITGLRLEVLSDERLPGNGPGYAERGNFVLTELRVTAAPLDDPLATEKVKLRNAQATVNQNGFRVSGAIDDKPDTGWAISPGVGRDQRAVFQFRGKIGYPGGTRLYVELDQQYEDQKHRLGKFRLSLTGSERPIKLKDDSLPVDIVAILRLPADQRSERQNMVVREFHRQLDAEWVAQTRAVDLVANPRLVGVQDLAWALINTPAFLFNH